jgi:PadR family transcriptional regulator PadR
MRDIFRETFLGFIRVHLLHHAAKQPIFGTEMIDELRRHGYKVSPGTLYPTLHGLEDAGYLRSEQQVVGGKVRRYYRGTARGAKALEKLKTKIRELTEEVLEDRQASPKPAAPKRGRSRSKASPGSRKRSA